MRRLLVLAAIVLLTTIATACGGGGDSSAAGEPATQAADPVAEFDSAVQDFGRAMRSFGAAAGANAGALPSESHIAVMEGDLASARDALSRAKAADLPQAEQRTYRDRLVAIMQEAQTEMLNYIDYAREGDLPSLQVIDFRFMELTDRIAQLNEETR